LKCISSLVHYSNAHNYENINESETNNNTLYSKHESFLVFNFDDFFDHRRRSVKNKYAFNPDSWYKIVQI